MFDAIVIGWLLGLVIFLFVAAFVIHKLQKCLEGLAKNIENNFVKCPDCASIMDKDAKLCLACGWRE